MLFYYSLFFLVNQFLCMHRCLGVELHYLHAEEKYLSCIIRLALVFIHIETAYFICT